jgi:hypothetical protein
MSFASAPLATRNAAGTTLRLKARLVVCDALEDQHLHVTQGMLAREKCETRITTVTAPLSFRQLERAVISLFCLNTQSVGIYYCDEEDDVITVRCNRDVDTMILESPVSQSTHANEVNRRRASVYVVAGAFATTNRRRAHAGGRGSQPGHALVGRAHDGVDQRFRYGQRYPLHFAAAHGSYDSGHNTLLWKELARLGRNVSRLRRENAGLRRVLMDGRRSRQQTRGHGESFTRTTRTTTIVAHQHHEEHVMHTATESSLETCIGFASCAGGETVNGATNASYSRDGDAAQTLASDGSCGVTNMGSRERENRRLRELLSKITSALDVTDDLTVSSSRAASSGRYGDTHGVQSRGFGSTNGSSKCGSNAAPFVTGDSNEYATDGTEQEFDEYVVLSSPWLSLRDLGGKQSAAAVRFRQAELARSGGQSSSSHGVGSRANSSSSCGGGLDYAMSDGGKTGMSGVSDASSLYAVVAGLA